MYLSANIQRHQNELSAEHNSNSKPLTSTPLMKHSSSVGYPEVTLHPIKSSATQAQLKQKISNDPDASINQPSHQTSSLLHGILTKVRDDDDT